jgi:predicted RNase H-like nuclease (RuvC/YqgF family)
MEELREKVEKLQNEKVREGREIERIKIEQERLDREYREIEDSLSQQMLHKDQRIDNLTKDIMFLQ